MVGAGCFPTLYKFYPGFNGQAWGTIWRGPRKGRTWESPSLAGVGQPFPSPGSSGLGPRKEGEWPGGAWPGRGGRGRPPPPGRGILVGTAGLAAYPYCLSLEPVCLGQALTPGRRRRWLHPGLAGPGGDCSCGPRSGAELAQVPGPRRSLLSVGARSPEEAVAAARSVPDLPRPQGPLSFTAPPTPITTLESRPTHPDSCPRAPTHGPADLSSGLPSPPSASLGPERLDPLRQALADEGLDSQALGSPEGAGTLDSEPLLGATATAPPCARPTGENEDEEQGGQQEEECPICTEPYGPGEHRLAQLNCGHGLCSGCLHRLLDTAPSADLGRVRCPLCRQKTPMLEWEICRLQEELLLADGPQRPPPPTPPTPPRRGPGPWASLEHHYQLRFLAGPVGGRGCLPFLPCPPCLGTRLWALRERGPCARRLGLLGLLGLELLGLLLTFTPLVLLGLLFMLLDRSGH